MNGPVNIVIAGAAETDEIGRLPDRSTRQLHLEAARNALAETPRQTATALGAARTDQP